MFSRITIESSTKIPIDNDNPNSVSKFSEYPTMYMTRKVARMEVGIDTKTNHIYQVIEIGANQTRTILTAKNIKTNQELDAAIFAFDQEKYEELNYMINN